MLKEIRKVFDRILIHTGQQPDYHLGVGFGRHDEKEGKEITKEFYSSLKFRCYVYALKENINIAERKSKILKKIVFEAKGLLFSNGSQS